MHLICPDISVPLSTSHDHSFLGVGKNLTSEVQPMFVYLSQLLTLVDGELGDAVREVAVLAPLAVAALLVVLAQRRLQVGHLPLPRRQLGAVTVVEGPDARLREPVADASAAVRAPARRGDGAELGAAVGVVAGHAAVAVHGAGVADVSAIR